MCELFLSLYQTTLFLAFGLAKIFFSHHILMNILIHMLFDDKKSLNSILYNRLTLNSKHYFKTRKPHLLYYKDMVKPYYIKGVHRVKKNMCSQMFYKIVVLERFCKFRGKHLCWSHFLIELFSGVFL